MYREILVSPKYTSTEKTVWKAPRNCEWFRDYVEVISEKFLKGTKYKPKRNILKPTIKEAKNHFVLFEHDFMVFDDILLVSNRSEKMTGCWSPVFVKEETFHEYIEEAVKARLDAYNKNTSENLKRLKIKKANELQYNLVDLPIIKEISKWFKELEKENEDISVYINKKWGKQTSLQVYNVIEEYLFFAELDNGSFAKNQVEQAKIWLSLGYEDFRKIILMKVKDG